MKTLALPFVFAIALSSTGCIVVGPPRASRAAVKSERGGGKACPPGHTWSDGRCHAKGKGHDR